MAKKNHYDLVDVLRGCAIAMMIVFHFFFDMANQNLVNINFYTDPFWLNFRTIIVSTFTFVMGMSFYLAHQSGFNRKKYLRRVLIILGCALLISLVTGLMDYYLNNVQFIYFGILHFIVLASVIALLFRRFYWLNLVFGLAIIIVNNSVQFRFFDDPAWNWIGFTTTKPITDDYAPLIPWLGSVLIGMFFARWAITQGNFPLFRDWKAKNRAGRLLLGAGQHSLLIYMLHQPVLIGSLMLYSAVFL